MREIRIAPVVLPALGLVLAGLVAGLAGCGGLKIASLWRDRDVVIDGVPAEWQGASIWVEDPNVAIAVMNDNDYIYLCFSTPVRSIASEIVHQGLTVWFDPRGESEKTFGIRCPVGFSGRPGGMGRPSEMGGARDRSRFGGGASGEIPLEELQRSVGSVQIIGPGKGDSLTLRASEADGVQVMLGHDSGRFVYELRVPLRSGPGHAYAIGYQGGGRIGIGFETPEASREISGGDAAGRRPPPGGGPGEPGGGGDGGWGGEPGGGTGSDGGGPGGNGGRPGGRPGGMAGPDAAERLQVWGKIELAARQ